MIRFKKEREKGFTLLELLVVVIVVGILAAVALPQFGKMINRARRAEADNIVGAILTAEFAYYQENSAFTPNLSDLLVDVPPDANHNWDYTIAVAAGPPATATVTATADAGPLNGDTVVGVVRSDGTRAPLVYTDN